MPIPRDIIKLGKRYWIIDMRDYSPIGSSYATRREAEDAMFALSDEEYGGAFLAKATPEEAARSPTELAAARANVTPGGEVGARVNDPEVSKNTNP